MTTQIRVRAPGRVNLIGDHTDYTGGLALPIAIDRWTEVTGTSSTRVRLRSREDDSVVDVPLDATVADAEQGWGRYVVAVVEELVSAEGIDGVVRSSLPIGSGLSSSASLEIAVALALGFEGSPTELAELAQRAEHRATGVPTGLMDQLCIAMARPGHATLIDSRARTVTHVAVPTEIDIVVRFVAPRTLEGSGYAARVASCRRAERDVGPLCDATLEDLGAITDPEVRRRARHVVTENERVRTFVDALAAGDHRTAGEVMVESHRSLRDDYEVSTAQIDAAVDEVHAHAGVWGARMTGGGFGGCVVAICEPGVTVDGWRVRPTGRATRLAAGA